MKQPTKLDITMEIGGRKIGEQLCRSYIVRRDYRIMEKRKNSGNSLEKVE